MGNVVYIVMFDDPTAGEGINGVWDNGFSAANAAWASSRECCRFSGEEGWPKKVQTYGKEVLRIEYGPESYTTVERHRVRDE